MKHPKNTLILFLLFVVFIQGAALVVLSRQRQGHLSGQSSPAPAPPAAERGRIALVIDDWGYNLKNRSFLTDNDFVFTISVLPFRSYSRQVAELAFENHKEVIVHMPMEPRHREKFGLEERTLMVGMDQQVVRSYLEDAFGSVPYARGLSNHMGSEATEDSALMENVLIYLKENGLFFLDSLVTAESVGQVLAGSLDLPFLPRDIFLDNDSSPDLIRSQVLRLAQMAETSGVAVGIGHDRPATIEVLREMLPRLRREGYRFIFLSEAIEDFGDL